MNLFVNVNASPLDSLTVSQVDQTLKPLPSLFFGDKLPLTVLVHDGLGQPSSLFASSELSLAIGTLGGTKQTQISATCIDSKATFLLDLSGTAFDAVTLDQESVGLTFELQAIRSTGEMVQKPAASYDVGTKIVMLKNFGTGVEGEVVTISAMVFNSGLNVTHPRFVQANGNSFFSQPAVDGFGRGNWWEVIDLFTNSVTINQSSCVVRNQMLNQQTVELVLPDAPSDVQLEILPIPDAPSDVQALASPVAPSDVSTLVETVPAAPDQVTLGIVPAVPSDVQAIATPVAPSDVLAEISSTVEITSYSASGGWQFSTSTADATLHSDYGHFYRTAPNIAIEHNAEIEFVNNSGRDFYVWRMGGSGQGILYFSVLAGQTHTQTFSMLKPYTGSTVDGFFFSIDSNINSGSVGTEGHIYVAVQAVPDAPSDVAVTQIFTEFRNAAFPAGDIEL